MNKKTNKKINEKNINADKKRDGNRKIDPETEKKDVGSLPRDLDFDRWPYFKEEFDFSSYTDEGAEELGPQTYKIEEIIENYRPLILASIKRYCNLMGFYEDLYQDGVVEIMEAMKEFDPALGSLGGYLKQRLRYFYVNKYKRLIRRETEELDESKEPATLSIADHENKMLVVSLLSELHPDERVVIELSFLYEMRGQEIARILGISRRKVYHLKDKAMRRLRKLSANYEL